MVNEKLISVLDQIAKHVEIENTKKYWMVRTDAGANYNTFSKGEFVALNIDNFPVDFLAALKRNYPDVNTRIPLIKDHLINLHREKKINLNYKEDDKPFSSNVGRLANQIATMAYLIKKGDIILIPDHGSNKIKIGRIIDDELIVDENINKHFSYARKVEWIKEISKRRLDPCLYKALGAHQAICDITKYSEYIERNYNSFFTINNQFHFVLAVNAENVSAWKLSNMVYDILNSVKTISEENNLGINIEEINFTINVNSPGKFSFITSSKGAVLIMAVVTALSGGTISYGDFEASTGGIFSSLVDCVNTWKDAQQEREQKAIIFDQQMKSLEMQSVEYSNDAYEIEEQEAIEEENLDEDVE